MANGETVSKKSSIVCKLSDLWQCVTAAEKELRYRFHTHHSSDCSYSYSTLNKKLCVLILNMNVLEKNMQFIKHLQILEGHSPKTDTSR